MRHLPVGFFVVAFGDKTFEKEFKLEYSVAKVYILATFFIFILILSLKYHFFKVFEFFFGRLLDSLEGLRELFGKHLALFWRAALAVIHLDKLLGRVIELRIVAHDIRRIDLIKLAHGDPIGDFLLVSLQ